MPGGVPVKLVPGRAVCSSRPVHFCVMLTSPQPHLKGPFSPFSRPTVIVQYLKAYTYYCQISQVLRHPLFSYPRFMCGQHLFLHLAPLSPFSTLFAKISSYISFFILGSFSFWSTSFRRFFLLRICWCFPFENFFTPLLYFYWLQTAALTVTFP